MTSTYTSGSNTINVRGIFFGLLGLLFTMQSRAQLTISKTLCNSCNCYMLSLKNTSKDTFYIVGYAWYYKYYNCIEGNITVDTTNKTINIPLSANFDSFRYERGDWKVIYPKDSSTIHMPKWLFDSDYRKVITAQVFYGRYRRRYKGTPDSRNRKLAKRLSGSAERVFVID